MNAKIRNRIRIVLLMFEWICAIFSLVLCAVQGLDKLPVNWVFNISADVVCMFINIFFIMGTMFGKELSSRKYALFLAVCSSNFFALFLDLHSWMIDGNTQLRWLVIVINTVLYITNLLLTAFFGHFILEIVSSQDKNKKKEGWIINGILMVSIITRILNLRYGFLFNIDELGVYHRGTYQFTAYIYTIIVQVMCIVVMFRYKVSRRQRIAVLAFTILPFLTAIISIFSYGFSITYACVLVSIVMIYSAFFVELETDKDKLRKLFGRYISNDVVQAIVDNPGGKMIPGRRYIATVFISDIRGFTALSEKMDPTAMVDMLNHYFGVITEIVSEHGGIVTEFLGDGIMCIFGAPNVVSDHAERAIAAALSVQKKIPEINKWNAEQFYPRIETGIGINTGSIVLGSIGNTKRARFTAIGSAVDKTYTIESCSFGGQVLISHSTLKSVKIEMNSRFVVDYIWDREQYSKTKIYEVQYIGEPWNIRSIRKTAEMVNLSPPIEIEYSTIVGKQTDIEKSKARILKLSVDSAVLEFPDILAQLDNIKLFIPDFGVIYAKVKTVRESTTLVNFISRPDGFERWTKKVIDN